MSKDSNGYTLLEILVVIGLIGLLAGIAAPRVFSVYRSVTWTGEKNEVFRQIRQLGYEALKNGRWFELKQYPQEAGTNSFKLPLDLPVGWQIKTKTPVIYNDHGVCFGGTLYVGNKERTLTVNLYPPKCVPVVE